MCVCGCVRACVCVCVCVCVCQYLVHILIFQEENIRVHAMLPELLNMIKPGAVSHYKDTKKYILVHFPLEQICQYGVNMSHSHFSFINRLQNSWNVPR